MSAEYRHNASPPRRRRARNTIQQNTLIGSKWTALTAVEHNRHFVVTGWANSPTDCDGAPDSVVIEAKNTGRSLVVAWRALRNGAHWREGWA